MTRRLGPFIVALILVGAVATPGCSSSEQVLCGEHSLPANAVPVPEPFIQVSTRSVEPTGCGAPFRRYAVLSGTAPTLQLLTEDYVAKITTTGWRKASCAKANTICFRDSSRELFLAVKPVEASADPTDGFPAPEDVGPQLLVAVSPSPPAVPASD